MDIVPSCVTIAVIVVVADCPALRDSKTQLTTPSSSSHSKGPGAVFTRLNSSGRSSTTNILAEVAGPSVAYRDDKGHRVTDFSVLYRCLLGDG